MGKLWWRNRWMDAVYESDLRPLERLVCAVYADHARDGQREAWVTLDRLCQRTGLSRDAANRARQGVREAGWLVVSERARQHRAAVEELTIPDDFRGTGDVPLSGASGTPRDTSGTPRDTSSTPRGLHHRANPSNDHTSSSSVLNLTRESRRLGICPGREGQCGQEVTTRTVDKPCLVCGRDNRSMREVS